MFNPSQEEVRKFFCGTWKKHQEASPLTALEALALDWILEHPEYHADLSDEVAALSKTYQVEQGRTNPFLHLSMHLAIAEQLSIDQPPGIRAIFQKLTQRLSSSHEAAHEVMESLGEIVWESQRNGTPPNTEKYLELMQRKLG